MSGAQWFFQLLFGIFLLMLAFKAGLYWICGLGFLAAVAFLLYVTMNMGVKP